MPLVGSFDRPSPLRRGSTPGSARASSRHSCPPDSGTANTADAKRVAGDLALTRFLTETLLGDVEHARAVVDELVAGLDAAVVTWSPSLATTSRDELISTLLDCDDALGDIDVRIHGEADNAGVVFTEWTLTGSFQRAGFLDDDVLVEPTNVRVASAGTLVYRFNESRVSRIHCFYDGLALLEALTMPSHQRSTRGQGPAGSD